MINEKGEFELHPHLLVFISNYPFYAELSRHVTKRASKHIPTAGVKFDLVSESLELVYNPDFMAKLSVSEVRGVLMHEFNHIVFKHLTARKQEPAKVWNIAFDCAINSLIVEKETPNPGEKMLPWNCCVPGHDWESPEEKALPADKKNGLADVIKGFPKLCSSERYYDMLQKAEQDGKCNPPKDHKCDGNCKPGTGEPGEGEPCPNCSGGPGTLDDHSEWANIPEDKRAIADNVVDGVLRKAVAAADQVSNGWGSIPAELRDLIRRSISGVVDWRKVLAQFVGKLVRGYKTTTFKRINRRFPYMHPGKKAGHVAKLLVARDESGSVCNDMLAEFTAELFSLTSKVEIDFLPFDCSCTNEDIVPWSRGQVPEAGKNRTKDGGTDFNAPTNVFNDPANRGRWDGMLIFTDGQAPKPDSCRGKRGWVVPKQCKLEFESDELQIKIDREKALGEGVTY